MNRILTISLLFLFSFCSKKEQSPYPRIIVPEQKDVVQVNAKEMLQSNIVALAREIDRDTVINEVLEFSGSKNDYGHFADADTIFPRYNFKIIVDTSYNLAAKNFYHKNIDLPQKGRIGNYYDDKRKLWKDYVNCLPLLILNKEKTPAFIKQTRIVQEAKDKNGVWKPIEFYDQPMGCIVSHQFFKFKPKKYEGIAIIKYHGDFKTKLRVKVQINSHYYYSNEFNGSVNQSQFSHDYLKKYIDYHRGNFDEDGFKAKYEKYTLLQYNF